MDRNYIAFISYRHLTQDKPVAEILHALIESYVIPWNLRKNGKKLGLVYRDEEESRVGHDLSEQLRSALDHSQYLIVVCSKETKNSEWVPQEIEYFLKHHPHENILTVLIEDMTKDDMPEALTIVTQKDGSRLSIEPWALDLSSAATVQIPEKTKNDGKQKPKELLKQLRRNAAMRRMKRIIRQKMPKLYASLLDCAYDDLVRREQRRKLQQMAAIFAIILMVGSAFAAMLLSKNRDLEQQRNEVLLRESELLTQNAREALTAGNRITAVSDALSALPDAENQRPYYGPAEAALIEALGIFDTDPPDFMIDRILIDQGTPIVDFVISEDGSKIITIDDYHTVRGFDSHSKEQLWSIQVTDQNSLKYTRLLPSYATNDVIVCDHNYLGTLNMDSGEESLLGAYRDSTQVYLLESPEKSFVMYLDSEENESENQIQYRLVLWDTRSQRGAFIPVDTGCYDETQKENHPYLRFSWADDRKYFAGALSDDGNLFAGYYTAEYDNGERWIHYFLADTENRSTRVVYRERIENSQYFFEPVRHIGFADHGESLLIVRYDNPSLETATALKVDIPSGSVVWQTALPIVDAHSYKITVHTLELSDHLLIADEQGLFLLDNTTGAILDSQPLTVPLDALLPVGDNRCAMISSDGTYMIGWADEAGFHNSGTYENGVVQIGQSEQCKIWNGGILGFDSAVTCTDGFCATVPADRNDCISITRIQQSSSPIYKKTVYEIPEGERFKDTVSRICQNGILALGSVGPTDQFKLARFELIDMESLESVGKISEAPTSIGFNRYHILPDASGFIYSIAAGNLIIYDEPSQTSTLLSGAPTEDIYGNTAEYADFYMAGSVTHTQSGDILSFCMEGNRVDVRINGRDTKTTMLPDGVDWWHSIRQSDTLIGNYGGNGYFVIGGSRHGWFFGENNINMIGAYNALTGKWTTFSCDSLYAADTGIVVGKSTPRFAAINGDRYIIYDISREKEYSTSYFPFRIENTDQCEFVMDDQYLFFYTYSSQVFVFDIHSGEMVYSEIIPSNGDRITVYEDPENSRLFVTYKSNSNSTPHSFCIDTKTWTKLADIPGMFLYDPERNQVFIAEQDDEGNVSHIAAVWLPGTEELIENCRTLFHLE